MIAVRMMKAAFDEVVDMVAMGNGFVAAARSVHVTGIVAVGRVGAPPGIGVAHRHGVFLDRAVRILVMEVAVVEVIDVSVVFDGGVAAAFAVLVVVVFVAIAHASRA